MSNKTRPSQYADQKGTILEVFPPNVAGFCEGATLPADGTAGFAPGCHFLLRGGTPGGSFYVNEGTVTSCDFNSWVNTVGFESVTAATRVLTAADSGKTFALNRAAGIAVTLPVPATGMWFRFVIGTTFTGAASIKSVAGAHVMVGHAVMGNDSDNTVVMWQALSANTFDTIDMFGTSNSTGGIQGQTVEIMAISTTLWHVKIAGDAAGTEATPFQDTVA